MKACVLTACTVLLLSACGGKHAPETTEAPHDSSVAISVNPSADSAALRPDSAAIFSDTLNLIQTFRDSGLVDVQELDARILVDLKYSTTDNFLRADVYGTLDKCFLRREAAEKLAKAQENLDKDRPGYHLLCYDCARPRRVQWRMWDMVKMPNKRDYVAPPWEGSVHNYGAAVDVTIADADRRPLDMGTPFDFFGPMARPDKEQQLLRSGELTELHLENRRLLRSVLSRAGLHNIQTEWWHFHAFPAETVRAKFKVIE